MPRSTTAEPDGEKALFSQKLSGRLPTGLPHPASPPAATRGPGGPCTRQRSAPSALWVWAARRGVQRHQDAASVRVSLMTYDVVSLSSCALAIGESLGEVFVQVFCPFPTSAPRGLAPLRPHHWGPGSRSGAHGAPPPLAGDTWGRDWAESAAP